MCESDLDEFVQLLDNSYVFQKDKLTVDAKMVFFRAMSTYPLATVRAAMSAHMLDPKVGKWAMQPADLIAQIQGMAGNDGRPGAEEAWAIALTGRDEADTVVWTTETAAAFAICQPVLEMGDEVGARMAFKEAYNRLVDEARRNHQPTQWAASLGWDVDRREKALIKASNAGRLAAPVVAALLPPPVNTASIPNNAKRQIDKIKEMLSTMNAEKAREAELHSQRERNATAAAKQRASDLAAQYKRSEVA